MAGLTGGNYLYLNVSGGRLVNKKKEIAYFGYEGTLLDIRRKEDEYEGQLVMKIELKMKDVKSDEIALISFTEESWYSKTFFERIGLMDLKHPFILGASASEQNDKVSFCWLKQGADTVKVDKDAFPKPEKNSRGKMTYDKMLDAIEPILQKLQAYFQQNSPNSEPHNPGKITPNTAAETVGQQQSREGDKYARPIEKSYSSGEPAADGKIYGSASPNPIWDGDSDLPFRFNPNFFKINF